MIRAPSGGANETAAMHAYDQVRKALAHSRHRSALGRARALFRQWRSLRAVAAVLSPLRRQAAGLPGLVGEYRRAIRRTCLGPTWAAPPSATSRPWSPIPEDLLHPRGETPRPGERRDVVWGKYVNGEVDHLQARSCSEHANASTVSPIGGEPSDQ